MKKVYLIMFESPYGAGSVHAVFSDEKAANLACFKLNQGRTVTRYRVDPWNLNEEVTAQ